MARFLSINGILTNGDDNIDRLASALETLGHEVIDLDLPVIGAWGASKRPVQMRNGRLARDAIVERFGPNPRIHAVCHSNGAATLFRAMYFPGVKFDHCFVFNGAMRSDWPWAPEGFDRLYNIYNVDDLALAWGIRLSRIMDGHIFGGLGKYGYDGPPDRRIVNVSNRFQEGRNNHNPWYTMELAHDWAGQIDRWLDEDRLGLREGSLVKPREPKGGHHGVD